MKLFYYKNFPCHKQVSSLRFLFYITLIFMSLTISWEAQAKNKLKAAPISISTCTDLQNMNMNLAGQYVLANDIDCSGVDFSPIGADYNAFTGALDGAGHTIKNLSITKSTTNYVGLFGYVQGAHIKQLILDNVNISGQYFTGALAGLVSGLTTISGVQAQGNVTSSAADIGGLAGHVYSGGSIQNSVSSVVINDGKLVGNLVGGLVGTCSGCILDNDHATGAVTGNSSVGGLVGDITNGNGTINHSYATGAMNGLTDTGGLIGAIYADNGAISIGSSYATGTVSGSIDTGGLVGYMYTNPNTPNTNSSSIMNSYATGKVHGSGSYTGGLVGNKLSSKLTTAITNSYAVGAVSGGTHHGGLIGGGSPADVTSSYWDTQTTGQLISAGGTGKTTPEMYQQNTYVGWDFTNVWNINDGKSYPWLRDQADKGLK